MSVDELIKKSKRVKNISQKPKEGDDCLMQEFWIKTAIMMHDIFVVKL